MLPLAGQKVTVDNAASKNHKKKFLLETLKVIFHLLMLCLKSFQYQDISTQHETFLRSFLESFVLFLFVSMSYSYFYHLLSVILLIFFLYFPQKSSLNWLSQQKKNKIKPSTFHDLFLPSFFQSKAFFCSLNISGHYSPWKTPKQVTCTSFQNIDCPHFCSSLINIQWIFHFGTSGCSVHTLCANHSGSNLLYYTFVRSPNDFSIPPSQYYPSWWFTICPWLLCNLNTQLVFIVVGWQKGQVSCT